MNRFLSKALNKFFYNSFYLFNANRKEYGFKNSKTTINYILNFVDFINYEFN